MPTLLSKNGLRIYTVPVTDFDQNCRIIMAAKDNTALVIDPGGDAGRILQKIDQLKASVQEIWLTHSHLDHCGAVQKLIDRTGARLLGHPIEKQLRQRVRDIAKMYGLDLNAYDACPEPSQYLEGGETISFDGIEFKVIFAPGHSPGHLCFYAASEDLLLAGDTIFRGSIGRTDLPGGDHQTLLNSIQKLVLSVTSATRILSGHGPDSTILEELKSNPFFQELRT